MSCAHAAEQELHPGSTLAASLPRSPGPSNSFLVPSSPQSSSCLCLPSWTPSILTLVRHAGAPVAPLQAHAPSASTSRLYQIFLPEASLAVGVDMLAPAPLVALFLAATALAHGGHESLSAHLVQRAKSQGSAKKSTLFANSPKTYPQLDVAGPAPRSQWVAAYNAAKASGRTSTRTVDGF